MHVPPAGTLESAGREISHGHSTGQVRRAKAQISGMPPRGGRYYPEKTPIIGVKRCLKEGHFVWKVL